MDRKAMARETLDIMKNGSYQVNGQSVHIDAGHKKSVSESRLYTPQEGLSLLEKYRGSLHPNQDAALSVTVENVSSVDAVIKGARAHLPGLAVLNFASAKNPGGGFLNGAMAQEEALAVSSGLYQTLTKNPEYYEVNRKCGTMMYTHYAIFSPDVVFFRDGRGGLLSEPCTASVLTLPAVNYGQVVLKGEDTALAKKVMRERMEICLALFAEQGCKNLILGAYGCGVFRNDPKEIARWWRELLYQEGFGALFDSVCFAVLDRSAAQSCIRPFQELFPG